MFNKVIFTSLILSTSVVFAAPATNSASIIDGEKVASLDISNNNWAIVANNSVNGKTKLREFYDMGDLGVQQIDYWLRALTKNYHWQVSKYSPLCHPRPITKAKRISLT